MPDVNPPYRLDPLQTIRELKFFEPPTITLVAFAFAYEHHDCTPCDGHICGDPNAGPGDPHSAVTSIWNSGEMRWSKFSWPNKLTSAWTGSGLVSGDYFVLQKTGKPKLLVSQIQVSGMPSLPGVPTYPSGGNFNTFVDGVTFPGDDVACDLCRAGLFWDDLGPSVDEFGTFKGSTGLNLGPFDPLPPHRSCYDYRISEDNYYIEPIYTTIDGKPKPRTGSFPASPVVGLKFHGVVVTGDFCSQSYCAGKLYDTRTTIRGFVDGKFVDTTVLRGSASIDLSGVRVTVPKTLQQVDRSIPAGTYVIKSIRGSQAYSLPGFVMECQLKVD